MELYTELNKNIEDLGKLFSVKMNDYDKKLQESSSPSHKTLDLSSLSHEFTEFRQLMWKSLAMLKAQTDLLALGLDRHETASRRKVLLLHGVPESSKEDVINEVASIFRERMKLTQISEQDVGVCHRLGSLRDKPRPILVRFQSYVSRCVVWNAKTALKGSGITLSEFLTKARHEAFLTARKHFGIHKCWTVEGKIVILLPDNSRAKIERMAELRDLTKKHPQVEVVTKSKSGAKKTAVPSSASNVSTTRSQRLKK